MPKDGENQNEREFWESARQNNLKYIQYYNRLAELSTSMFEWTGLPDTCDARFLELALFRDGHAIFFKDDTVGFLTLRCILSAPLNVYGIPTNRRAYSYDINFNIPLDEKNSVIVYNNYLHLNSMLDVELFAKRLAELDRIMEVNTNAQKTPVLISCDEKQRLALENVYMKYSGNQPVIYGDKNMNPNVLKAIVTNAPYVADKLYQLKTQIWNEALTYLGISNVNMTKKERMISDEVIRNQGGTIASRYSRLEMRRKACEEINKMFGLNIWCDYREDYREADDEIMFAGESGDGGQDTLAIDMRTR